MIRPDPAHLETARRLLSHETAAAAAESSETTAAGRVYDKLVTHLASLLGDAGVRLLLVRSAKLAEVAGVAGVAGSADLRERLCARAHEHAIATEDSVAMFSTFFALLTTFIGERLTTQLLRTAWPTIEPLTPTEPAK